MCGRTSAGCALDCGQENYVPRVVLWCWAEEVPGRDPRRALWRWPRCCAAGAVRGPQWLWARGPRVCCGRPPGRWLARRCPWECWSEVCLGRVSWGEGWEVPTLLPLIWRVYPTECAQSHKTAHMDTGARLLERAHRREAKLEVEFRNERVTSVGGGHVPGEAPHLSALLFTLCWFKQLFFSLFKGIR